MLLFLFSIVVSNRSNCGSEDEEKYTVFRIKCCARYALPNLGASKKQINIKCDLEHRINWIFESEETKNIKIQLEAHSTILTVCTHCDNAHKWCLCFIFIVCAWNMILFQQHKFTHSLVQGKMRHKCDVFASLSVMILHLLLLNIWRARPKRTERENAHTILCSAQRILFRLLCLDGPFLMLKHNLFVIKSNKSVYIWQ